MEKYFLFINQILIFEFAYFIVSYISFMISMWKIFEKESIPAYYSLIPFYNIYKYYKICRLPFWTIFIPVVNIIAFYCSFYVITKDYRCKRWICVLAIFFPFIILPYIAFSDKKNINFKYDNVFLRNNKDVSKLEDSLLAMAQADNIENEFSTTSSTISVSTETNEDLPSENEQLVIDEYVYDDYNEVENIPDGQQLTDDIVELDEDLTIDELSIANFDKYEKNLDVSSSTEKNINTNIQDYKDFEISNESIAFGGEEQKEEIYELEAKNDELKCKRCGSSLVGAVNNVCPGCGAPINVGD